MLAGCTTLPGHLTSNCAKLPQIAVRDGVASTDLRVMTYNIEGLPWPARSGRTPFLREIGRRLAEQRSSSDAPDIILVQEAFSTAAGEAVGTAGYPNRIIGPVLATARARPSNDAPSSLTSRRKLRKGEGLGPLLSGGLYILSEYPVIAHASRAFRKGECAGYDCFAKKGVQWARINIPGLPGPIDLFNTHLQSRGSSGVSRDRSFQAHRLQVSEVSRFIQEHRSAANPMIFGGDFNMRNSTKRFEHFEFTKPWPLVHRYCADPNNACRVLASWDGDAPWMDTQDLLGFDDGAIVRIRPIEVESRFDEPWRGRPLADHDALLVTYRLSWPIYRPIETQAGLTGGGRIGRACSNCGAWLLPCARRLL
jgi:endonuclease/exonuclease/phosphatase family metal-dependent hydrolase